MKTKKYILKGLATCLIAASLSACVDLEPKAMSFLTPENTFVDKAGLETMLRLCRKQMNFEWFGDAFNSGNCETYSVYEYAWSDLAVMGGPETKEIHNMVTQLTPYHQYVSAPSLLGFRLERYQVCQYGYYPCS